MAHMKKAHAKRLNSKDECIVHLFDTGVIQEGSFVLKSGISSPIYIDMRRIISHPELYAYIVDLLWQEIGTKQCDVVSGVPHAAVPLASGITILYQKPMVMIRKEKKDHGTSRMIEGDYAKGGTILLIEDVATSGASIVEIVDLVLQEGMVVNDVVVFLDREQGARERLLKKGIKLHAVCTLSDILSILEREGKLDGNAVTKIKQFIAQHQF